jgi:hypothetical protein
MQEEDLAVRARQVN